jgi:salicylate 5-hydroxylase large subunit
MISTRGSAGQAGQVTQVSSFKAAMTLHDPSFIDIVPEAWWAGPTPPGHPKASAAPSGGSEAHGAHEGPSLGAPVPTAVMTTIFPSVILQQQVNSVSTRHIQPNGRGSFDFVWTHFGFEDDDAAMTQRRLTQANLFGPAGFVSADDGEVIEFSQQAFESKPSHHALAELGGRGVEDTEHMVTETLIRGMYRYWRQVMEAEPAGGIAGERAGQPADQPASEAPGHTPENGPSASPSASA